MKKIIYLLMVITFSGNANFNNSAVNDLNDFKWILGLWKYDTADNIIYEKWIKVSSGTFEGLSYTISKSNGDTLFAESLRLLEMNKNVYYLAKVEHNIYPVPFKLVGHSVNSFVFENNEHDFPQRLIYSLETNDALNVTVEGDKSGQNNGFIIQYVRAAD